MRPTAPSRTVNVKWLGPLNPLPPTSAPTVGPCSRDDLVLLDRDPIATTDDPRTHLRGVSVALTVIAGEVVHSRL